MLCFCFVSLCGFITCVMINAGGSQQTLAAGDASDKLYISTGGLGIQAGPSPGGISTHVRTVITPRVLNFPKGGQIPHGG